MNSWLIAHRGSQCDATENTLAAFRATAKYDIAWVELDLHTTSDGIVIVHHDFDIKGVLIATNTFYQLKLLDSNLITFQEALKVIPLKVNLIIEIKALGTGKNILPLLINHQKWLIASYEFQELNHVANLGIDKNRLLLLQHKHPFGHYHKVKRAKFGGMGIKKYYINPVTYIRARRNKLFIFVYTVNSYHIARLLHWVYPQLQICTNRLNELTKIK